MARNNLDVKRFSEYTEEEQKVLLNHWWHYYGKVPVSLSVVKKFNELLDSNPEFVKNVALIGYVEGKSSQDLINVIRLGRIDEFKEAVEKIVSSEEFLMIEEDLERCFFEEVVGSYNNPQPPIPFSEEQIFDSLLNAVRECVGPNCEVVGINLSELMRQQAEMNGEYLFDCADVYKIYEECLLNKEFGELGDDEPTVEFAIGEGIKCAGVFSIQRLADNKEMIIKMVDQLSAFESEVPFVELCVDRHGRQWTNDYAAVDALVQLGVATEILSYPYDRSEWATLPGKIPFVMRNHEKDKSDVRGYEAKEFKKVYDEVKKGTYRRDTE